MRWPFKKHPSEKDVLIEKIKKEPLEFESLFNNISNRAQIETLYKELCMLSHPDRFANDPEKQEAAERLFKEIQLNRYNYTGLLKIIVVVGLHKVAALIAEYGRSYDLQSFYFTGFNRYLAEFFCHFDFLRYFF